MCGNVLLLCMWGTAAGKRASVLYGNNRDILCFSMDGCYGNYMVCKMASKKEFRA